MTAPAIRPAEMTRTFVIADLSGYTALTESHGGMEAAKIVNRFVALAEESLASGARVFERVGDEIVIVADDPAAGAHTAVRLRDAVDREPLFPAVRVGVHAGPVYEDAGHYFGTALNLTARLAGHARLPVGATTYYFRSFECARAFAAHPKRYA